MIGPTNGKNQFISGGDPVSDTDSGSLLTSFSIAQYGILGHLLVFCIVSFRQNSTK